MKQHAAMLISIAAFSLAACSEQPAKEPAPTASTSEPSASSATTAVGGRGTGTVKSIDPAAGKITIDHGAIPDANWPAMTMTFEADRPMLKNIAPGEKVAFTMAVAGNGARITAIGPLGR